MDMISFFLFGVFCGLVLSLWLSKILIDKYEREMMEYIEERFRLKYEQEQTAQWKMKSGTVTYAELSNRPIAKFAFYDDHGEEKKHEAFWKNLQNLIKGNKDGRLN